MRRREFIAGLGGMAAAASSAIWPQAAHAQQAGLPVIGLLNGVSFASSASRIAAIRQGLKEIGYVEGQNVAIEYRSAEAQYDRLPALAADLVSRPVAAIIAIGAVNSVLAAKAATTTIPIVFVLGSNPVQFGIVASLNRPGGNITGLTSLGVELLAKRLEILRELVPRTDTIGLLVNPNNPNTDPSVKELERLASAGGWILHVGPVKTGSDLDTAFATLAQVRAGGVLTATDALFTTQRDQIVVLAARYNMPSIYPTREAVEAGGLLSYGVVDADMYRQAGIYTGRILKGEKPADLPVQQSVKIELIINLKTAKALRLTIPETLLATADEVIQ